MEKSSLTCEEMAAQLAVLRRKNEELADQVKRLVATEHKLYETQEAIDSRMHIYRQLHEYGKKFNTCFDIDEIFRLTLKFVLYELNFSCALVFLYEQRSESFYLHMMDGFYDEDSQSDLKNMGLPLSSPAIEPLHAGAERIICESDCDDEVLLELGRRLTLAEYQVNLLAGTRQAPYALLFVGNRQQDTEFSTRIENEGDMMIGLGNLVAQVFTSIQNIRSYQDLKQANKLKDEFLANTSHELRTPLHGIIGLADSMLDGVTGELTPEQALNLSLIDVSGRRLANMVNDILDFSRLKHRDIQLIKKPLDMATITRVVFMLLAPLVEKKDLKLINRIEPGTPPAFADEDRMEQIMYNLVGNAVKFTDSGTISVSAAVENGQLAVTVSDTGIGIVQDKQARIFKSFEQADGSTERRFRGSGLGLAVTRKLVELHGGRIRVESEPGKGSAFIFTVPVSSDRPAEPGIDTKTRQMEREDRLSSILPDAIGEIPQKPVVSVEPGALEKKILIVDDEPVNLQVIKNQLAGKQFFISMVTSGAEAILAVESDPGFDLVLLDIMMPGMSGYEVCRQLRKKYAANELPILMLTAKNRVEDLVAGFHAGANDYLAKPFSKDELLARVDTQLYLKSLVAENTCLQTELHIARELQRMVLPTSAELQDIEGLDISGYMQPAEEVGGDYYDVLKDGQWVKIGIGDVTGHGLLSGVVMLMTQTAVRTLQVCGERNPTRFLDILNRVIFKSTERMQTDKILTLAILDYNQNRIRISGQHEKVIIVRDGGKTELVDTIDLGFPIGLKRNIIDFINETKVVLDPGDGVVLYSDGITEAENMDGVGYGLEQLCHTISSCWHLSAEAVKETVIKNVWAHIGSQTVYDDLTIVVIKQQPETV
jgi:two-component system, sensor histidine kinase ChiS